MSKPMNESEQKAYDGGFNCAKRGLTVEDNPYPQDMSENSYWSYGYYDYFYE